MWKILFCMSSVITDYDFSGGMLPNLLQIVVSGFVFNKKIFAKSGVSSLHVLYYKNIYYMQ